MSTEFAQRPQFFEGQYLGAEDLQALITYFSELLQRHQLGSHSWGIAAGIDLIYQTSPQGAIEAYLTPGIATDGYGRVIVVAQPFPLDAGLFAGQPAGLVNVWIRYDEAAGQGVRQGFQVCNAVDAYARVVESFLVEVGERKTIDTRQSGVAVGDETFADAREAPGWLLPPQPADPTQPTQPIAPDGSVAAQRFPAGDDPNLWLIPVGRVLWQGGALVAPTPASMKQSRIFRRHSGWIGEALYGTGGLLRLAGRFIPRDPKVNQTVDQICDAQLPTENDLIFCTADPNTPEFREPIWLDADTRARGHLRFYGTRAEWVDVGGTDYLPPVSGTVTALRRTAPSPLNGVDLEVLLGAPQGTSGPSRLTIGAATVNGTDPCALGFDYTRNVAIQQDGRVGIGVTDKVLDKPLTLRAIGANGLLEGFESGGGTLAWQFNLGAGGGFNLTQADPTATNLFVATTGNVGIGTQAPTAKLDLQELPPKQAYAIGDGKWLRMGSITDPDAGRAWFQYGPQLAPLLVLSDLDDPPRVQFQQQGSGTEASAQFSSWIGMARGSSSDLALSGGNVGIGTTTPSARLEVTGGGGQTVDLRVNGRIHTGDGGNAGGVWLDSGQTLFVGQNGSNVGFWTQGVGWNALQVTQGGNVGIGTTGPAEKLDVRGNIKLGAAGEFFAVAAGPNLLIVAGSVSAAGNPLNGSGFTSNFIPFPSPTYTVLFNTPFAGTPIVTATLIDDDDNVIAVSGLGVNGFSATIRDVAPLGGDENQPQQTAFCFIAIGLRA